MPGTLNMWSAVQNVLAFPVDAPNYMDLSIGLAYCIAVANTTNADITSGVLELENADARPDNPCEPDVWEPMEPVSGCAPIVSGIPEVGPVTIDLRLAHVPAHSVCLFAAPCPKQFFRVSGAPAGVTIIGIISRLRRTDWSHTGPMGFVPMPLAEPFGTVGLQAPAQQAPATQTAAQVQRRTAQPAQPAQPVRPRPRQPAE